MRPDGYWKFNTSAIPWDTILNYGFLGLRIMICLVKVQSFCPSGTIWFRNPARLAGIIHGQFYPGGNRGISRNLEIRAIPAMMQPSKSVKCAGKPYSL
jgi:hypothetical protein